MTRRRGFHSSPILQRGRQGLAFGAARAIVAATFSGTAQSAMRPLLVPLALCGTLALAACGVKGPLEPPPGAHATPPAVKPAAQQTAATSAKPGTKPGTTTADGPYIAPTSDGEILDSATPHAEWQKKKVAPGATTGESPLLKDVKKPDQPFILDGLL